MIVKNRRNWMGYIYYPVVVLIMLLSAGLICYRIAEPLWESGHQGYHMSEYPHNALNYLRFGYKETKMGLVMNYGDHNPTRSFSYRVDHPMVTPFLISLAYRAFGISPWSARLVPVLFALGTCLMTWGLGCSILEKRWASLISLVFCALSPVIIYYGRMPAPHHLSAFFAIVFFYFYWHWFVTERRCYFGLSLLTLVVGAYTDWIIYFTVPAAIVHYIIYRREDRDWKRVVVLALAPFLLFLSYIAWVWWLTGSQALRGLWSIFLNRTTSTHGLGSSLPITSVWQIVYKRSMTWVTFPVLLLSVAWLGRLLKSVFQERRVDAKQGFLMAMLGFGLGHNAVFLNLVLVHDFVMFYHLVPVVALMSASFVDSLIGFFHQKKLRLLSVLIVIVSITGFVYQSVSGFVDAHKRPIGYLQAYYVGKRLNSIISRKGRYVDAVNLFEHAGQLRAYVTADRPFARIDTLEEFKKIEEDPIYEAVIVDNGANTDLNLREYLLRHYDREDVMGYSIFDLSRKASSLLASRSEIEKLYPISFGDQIEFLGYEVDEVVYRNKHVDHLWRKYLNPNVGYLPRYATFLHVVNYWRIPSDRTADLSLETYLTEDNKASIFEGAQTGLSGLYPTSDWPVDQILREELNIVVPSRKSVKRHPLWVRASRGSDYLAPGIPSGLNGGKGLARIGQVYILDEPLDPDIWPLLQPDADKTVLAELDEKISLIGISISQRAGFPGDVLLYQLNWKAHTPVRENYKVFVHMIDSEGRLVAQHDSDPKLGRSLTSSWASDELIHDVHPIHVPGNLSPGVYRIYVGMYNLTDMQRLVVGECSNPVQNDAIYVADVIVLDLKDL